MEAQKSTEVTVTWHWAWELCSSFNAVWYYFFFAESLTGCIKRGLYSSFNVDSPKKYWIIQWEPPTGSTTAGVMVNGGRREGREGGGRGEGDDLLWFMGGTKIWMSRCTHFGGNYLYNVRGWLTVVLFLGWDRRWDREWRGRVRRSHVIQLVVWGSEVWRTRAWARYVTILSIAEIITYMKPSFWCDSKST